MEPATQALASIALARAGLNRLTPHATPILIAAALAPDLDSLSVLGGAAAFLRCHRSLFHCIAGGFALALALAAIATPIIRRGKISGEFASMPSRTLFLRTLAICSAGIALHLLLDLCDASGVRLYWPVRWTWQGWYLAPNLDPLIVVTLIAAIALPALFSLVSEEIGERKRKSPTARRWAVAAFLIVAVYLSVRAVMHSRAIDLLQSAVYRGEVAPAAGAYPDSVSPFEWRGIAATDDTLQEVELHLNSGERFDPDQAITHYKPARPEVLAAAEKATIVRAFVSYARFPIASVEQTDFGDWHIELRDLRVPANSHSWENLIAAVDLNSALQIQHEEIRFAH